MTIEVGKVFSTSWQVIRERFWPLVGMWLLHIVFQTVFSTFFTIVLAAMTLGLGAAATGLEDPDAFAAGGMGVGMIVMLVLYYFAYFVVMLLQQCSMSALATPLERVDFGEALKICLKCTPPLAALTAIACVAIGAVALLFWLGETMVHQVNPVVGVVAIAMFVLLSIYVSMRMLLLIPVIAIERVYGPIEAVRRTWNMSSGSNVIGIFVVVLGLAAISLGILGLPLALILGPIYGIEADGLGTLGILGVAGGVLLLIPLFIVFSIVTNVVYACLHAQLTDRPHERVKDTFS